ncbi:XRE family transcriptional regulator [Bacilli bacterium]|nr:hypothetical protein WH51_13410 [Bacilli bacterium VT-13-104]PZD84868.1 XRE family transcriptional regulator [Bacilli bacterium]PZD86361.1 XRE family transcriptional regulator [Bacilli bacterium]PZD89849.1 XRE family transcriptional regulator [Bacilli bacterium]RCO05359.1 XRE family transcriptional regulator [Bacilli bacterium]
MNSYHLNEKDYELLKTMTLGKKVRYFRNLMSNLHSKSRFSTAELAKRIGVTPQSLTSIEREETKRPSFDVIQKLSKELNVPIDVFTDDFYLERDRSDITLHQNNSTYSVQVKFPSTNDSDNFQIGYLLYQHLEGDEVRIILHEKPNGTFDNSQLINVLAQQLSTIELNNILLNKEDVLTYSTNTKSPYSRALEVYRDLYQKEKHPIGSYSTWQELLANYNEHAKYHTKMKVKE